MLTYLFIFIAKIIEVSLATLRTVLLTRGEKLYAAMIGFCEVIIWLLIIGNVLDGIREDPLRMFVYALGFACGNYVGSTIEEKLAIGLMTINVIISKEDTEKMVELLRQAELGVTTVSANGINNDKTLLIIHAKRKRKNEIIKLIQSCNINTMITVNDTKTVYGGYGVRK
jgi:uncharacterized protein YebE (UPF0316 family)